MATGAPGRDRGSTIVRVCRRYTTLIGLFALAFALAACGGNAQPDIVTLPPAATPTDISTPTVLVNAGLASVATATPLPTRPPTTPTPGPSPTNPLAPTHSPAPATETATRAPTRSSVSIEYFTTNSETVKPGDNVTLFWGVRGASTARIFRVDEDGERIWRWDVNASGQLTVGTRAQDRDVARFLLEVDAGDGTVEQPLLIPLNCPETWFFDPAPEACPAGPPQVTMQAEQTFERGRMIWVEAQDRIYVIFEDGASPTWALYPDNFEEGDPERDDSIVSPSGMQQPVRGFGLVWRSNQRVRDRLGWAVSPEVAFEGMFQADAGDLSVATLYLRMRDGGIIALDALTDEWEVLPFSNTGDGTP